MKEVTESYVAANVESNVRKYWDAHNTYRKTRALRSGGRPWLFVDGPPYTTGYIHLGTAWNKILKDSILRYHSMTGKNIVERAGYDMHGLPIEVKVEEKLGFKNKADIEKHGVANFIEECREFALTHKDLMSDQFKNLGVWMDFDDPYQTVDSGYIEAAWYTLKRCEEEHMLERGSRVVNWCPRCGTAIADAEVEYWDETDPSIFVKFPIVGRDNEYLVIWTTTPWTLPANIAVAVGKDFVYAKIRAVKDGKTEDLWIAKDLAEQILKYGKYQDYSVLETKTGAELVGTKYTSPLEAQVPLQKQIEHRVVAADYVAMENTGMVHIAPGHGWDDYLVGLRENLPIVCPVDGNGNFTEEAGIFAGLYVKDEETNNKVIEALGPAMLAKRKITHRYGHCWRCKTPIIYRATSQWFLKAKDVRDKMLAEIANDVTWYPDWAGSARFHDWIEEARDWCISRQRYWGIPIPVWVCPVCNKYHVVGRYAELEELSGQKMTDPHRPYVDDITIPCECGGTMKRVPDIFDVWYDSGVASWATLRFPQQTEAFEKDWPAEFILEGQDQTRGWFYSQLALSTIAFGKAPYKSVLMHGFALDANGKKMSKSLGNVIAPEDVISQFGVDVLRQYILSASAPWDDLRFSMEGVKTTHRMFNVLWNVYRFPLPYMQLDNYTPAANAAGAWDPAVVEEHIAEFGREDRWLVSRVNSLAAQVTKEMEVCNLHRATRPIATFVLDELSRWYVQLVRPRMWLEEDSVSKKQAYDTMYYVLRRLLTILAPFAPHITEEMYQNLRLSGDVESVHMQDWFVGKADLIDSALEEEMEIVQEFDEAVANARQNGKRKGRWPVGEIVVATSSPQVADAISVMNDMCCDRANARSVKTVTGVWDRVEWTALPVMKAIGKQFGRDGPKVKAFIEESDGTVLKAALARDGKVAMERDGFAAELTEEHMVFEERMPENVFSSPLGEGSMVYVDVSLTPELESEGYAREVIRRIQEMRKQAGLAVDAKISCEVVVMDTRVAELVDRLHDLIADEVRAACLKIRSPEGKTCSCRAVTEPLLKTEWEIDDLKVSISIAQEN
ncbi:MAG TPA: isoleucine--tRNA ligase [Methanocorpusculum sp.]|nr:isoleucine--tRNA ligase [Methanocorpusculum sp.]